MRGVMVTKTQLPAVAQSGPLTKHIDTNLGVVHFWPLLGSRRARESGRSVAWPVRFVGLFCAVEAATPPRR